MSFLRYCKIIIFGTFGMSGHTNHKCYYQIMENFDVDLYVKNEHS